MGLYSNPLDNSSMSFCHDDDYAELYEIKEKNKRQSARRMLPTIREIKEVSVVKTLISLSIFVLFTLKLIYKSKALIINFR